MWITQSYLGNVEPEAKIFVYYLFEDYIPEQTQFTKSVQHYLETLGEYFEDKVSLLMPNPRYTAQIGAEVRGIEDLWWSLKGKLPALLISNKPLSQFNMKDGKYAVIPFESKNPKDSANIINEVKRIINDQLSFEFSNRKIENKTKSIWSILYEAIEAKPGICGFAIDLKKLRRKI
jgi:hypothetical protein